MRSRATTLSSLAMFLPVVRVLADVGSAADSAFLRHRHAALLSMTCREIRRALFPLIGTLAVDEAYRALIDGVCRLKDRSRTFRGRDCFICFDACAGGHPGRLRFKVTRNCARQTLSIRCMAEGVASVSGEGRRIFERMTSFSSVHVPSFADPRKVALRELAVHQLYLALMTEVVLLRPRAEIHRTGRRTLRFYCIERRDDRTLIHFVVSRRSQSLVIRCTRPTHSYISERTPFALVRQGKFLGRQTSVNLITGYTSSSVYVVDRPWTFFGRQILF